MEVWDQGEKSHTALWTINLKTKVKSAVLLIFQPHLAVLHLDHEGGLVRVGGLDEHHQVAVEGAA